MQRLLKPGGILMLSTPQRYSPLNLAARIALLPGRIQLTRIYRQPVLKTGHINLLTGNNGKQRRLYFLKGGHGAAAFPLAAQRADVSDQLAETVDQ